jgi:hypothetical protein
MAQKFRIKLPLLFTVGNMALPVGIIAAGAVVRQHCDLRDSCRSRSTKLGKNAVSRNVSSLINSVNSHTHGRKRRRRASCLMTLAKPP